MNTRALNTAGYIYLLLVPFFAGVLGFGVGHVSYKIYIPVWILNVIIMLIAAWFTGLNIIRFKNEEQSHLAKAAFFLIVPWILISMFAGLGPPPENAIDWTLTSTEQQIRYSMLVVAGLFLLLGIAVLKDRLKKKGESFYSLLALISILITIPLFIINMLYWGFYLTELFRIQTEKNILSFPDWFLPVRQLFGVISAIEVSLTYVTVILIAASMKKVGLLNNRSNALYMLFSITALIIMILSVFLTETFKTAGFAVSIPAVPFLMPYIIGVNLLKKISITLN
ncbi:hypothetical protein [Ignavibacterium album]|uniref:hypothetical protein n=1 Tax=Ignavibacterium album TaxID=591197 RepID=UPI0026F03D59|nr:hypothetical protein [Ignavibacterium album]